MSSCNHDATFSLAGVKGRNPISELFGTGGTRHILRDFQEQLQALRGQIAMLTAQNTELRTRCSAADAEIFDQSKINAELERRLSYCQDQLQNAQVRCLHLAIRLLMSRSYAFQ